jgi:hypothetical protein
MIEKVSIEAGKHDEYVDMKYNSKPLRSKIERNFGEITSNEDFE